MRTRSMLIKHHDQVDELSVLSSIFSPNPRRKGAGHAISEEGEGNWYFLFCKRRKETHPFRVFEFDLNPCDLELSFFC